MTLGDSSEILAPNARATMIPIVVVRKVLGPKEMSSKFMKRGSKVGATKIQSVPGKPLPTH